MTGGRFDAEPRGQGEPDEGAKAWEASGTWEHAETWDYDEARAEPEAYDLLELRLMGDREQGPRFDRFQAAIADTPPPMANLRVRSRSYPPADPTWLDAVRTGRFWLSALWLLGAGSAGVLAGMVSTNLVALALNPAASSVVAEQLARPAATPRAALSAPAASAVTTLAQAAARPVPNRDPAPEDALASETASRSVQTAARQAGPLAAETATPTALRPAALIEPAPGAAPAAEIPADQAERERAPTPPPAASEARVTTPLPPAVAQAPSEEYRVQLAMLRDKRNVKYVWHDFATQFGPSARNLKRYVFPTQTARGTRHLVQVGPFANEGQAEAMCSKLKQRGGDCVVVRQPS